MVFWLKDNIIAKIEWLGHPNHTVQAAFYICSQVYFRELQYMYQQKNVKKIYLHVYSLILLEIKKFSSRKIIY